MEKIKYVELDEIVLKNRIITPISRLSVNAIQKSYLFLDYTVAAFKIQEDELTYYVNVFLSDDEFSDFKKQLSIE